MATITLNGKDYSEEEGWDIVIISEADSPMLYIKYKNQAKHFINTLDKLTNEEIISIYYSCTSVSYYMAWFKNWFKDIPPELKFLLL